MREVVVRVLRVLVVVATIGTVVVQALLIPLVGVDLAEAGAPQIRVAVVAILLLGMGAVQVVLLAVWRLATMAQRGTFFSPAAFRWVDVIAGAVGLAAVLLLAFGAVLAPGDLVPPGFVLLLGGAAVLVAALAMVVLVIRTLIAQAVARDLQADRLQAELDEVI